MEGQKHRWSRKSTGSRMVRVKSHRNRKDERRDRQKIRRREIQEGTQACRTSDNNPSPSEVWDLISGVELLLHRKIWLNHFLHSLIMGMPWTAGWTDFMRERVKGRTSQAD